MKRQGVWFMDEDSESLQAALLLWCTQHVCRGCWARRALVAHCKVQPPRMAHIV